MAGESYEDIWWKTLIYKCEMYLKNIVDWTRNDYQTTDIPFAIGGPIKTYMIREKRIWDTRYKPKDK